MTLAATCLSGCLNVNRVMRIEQVAVLPAPTAARVNGPLPEPGHVAVSGDITFGVVAKQPEQLSEQTARHESVATLLRGALSLGINEHHELSAWADVAARFLAQDNMAGIDRADLGDTLGALWGGLSWRSQIPIEHGAVLFSTDFGLGSVPYARRVLVTDDILVAQEAANRGFSSPLGTVSSTLEPPGEGWIRVNNAFIRRDRVTAARFAQFLGIVAPAGETGHWSLSMGVQLVPYVPGLRVVDLSCANKSSPSVRDTMCGNERDEPVLGAAMITTLAFGADFRAGPATWLFNGWWHMSDFGSGAATSPVGLSVGARY